MPKAMRIILGAALLAMAQLSQATGFFVNQQSVRGLGRVNAGVAAAADDASTIFFNAAGLPHLWEGEGSKAHSHSATGVNVVIPRASVTNAGSTATTLGTGGQALPYAGGDFCDPTNPAPVPNLYFARRIGDSAAYYGLGVNAPFGQAAKYDAGWFGRYDAIEVSLGVVNLGAVAAYALSPSITLGGGIDVQHARTKLVAALPDPFTLGGANVATDGQSVTRGTSWAEGFNLGAMFTLPAQVRVGLSYRSAIDHRLSGEASVSGLGGLLAASNGTRGARATLKLPQIAGIGVMQRATRDLSLFAQYDWFGWSRFDEIVVSFDDGTRAVRQSRYRDAWAVSTGAEYALSRTLALRAGVRFDRTPTVDGFRDTTLPDADRRWVGIGASYRPNPAASFDVALNHVAFGNGKIDVTRAFFEGTPIQGAARIRGNANSRVDSISFNWSQAF